MDVNDIKPAVNKGKVKKHSSSRLGKNTFKKWLIPYLTLNKNVYIQRNVPITYRKTDLTQPSPSTTPNEKVSLIYPHTHTFNTHENKVILLGHSKSTTHTEKTSSVAHPELNTNGKKIILLGHTQLATHLEKANSVEQPQSNTHERKIILLGPLQSNAHKQKATLVEQSQLTPHIVTANSVEHPKSNTHERKAILLAHSQSTTHKEEATLIEQSQSTTHREKTNLVEHPESNTHERKMILLGHSQSITHKEEATLIEQSQPTITHTEKANSVEYPELNTHEKKVILLRRSQSTIDKEETTSVLSHSEHPDSNIHGKKIILLKHPQLTTHTEKANSVEHPQSNTHERKIILLGPLQSNAHKQKATLVEQPQSTIHTETINAVEHPESNKHEKKLILLRQLLSTTPKEEATLVEQSQSTTCTEKVNSVEHPESNTHKRKIILFGPLPSTSVKEGANLVEQSQSTTHTEKANSVKHPESNTHERKIILFRHLPSTSVKEEATLVEQSQSTHTTHREKTNSVEHSESNTHERKTILLGHLPLTSVKKEATLIEQSQSTTHTEKANSVKHPESNTHERKIILLRHLPSTSLREEATLVEQSQSTTHTEKANSVERPESNTYERRTILLEHLPSTSVKEEAISVKQSQSTTRTKKVDSNVHSQSVTSIEKDNSRNLSRENINFFSHENKVKQVEIKICAFLVQHNIPFHSLNRLIPLIKDIGQDTNVVARLSLEQSTSNTQVIEECEVGEMIKHLRICKFSILIGGTTNNSKQVMCVLAQYISPQDKKIMRQMLNLISIELTDPADTFYRELKEFLERKKIPLQNIVAVVSDHASMTTGCSSVISHLKLEIPKLLTLNCIGCASTNIVNSAYAHIPQACEHFIQEIVFYISDNIEQSTCLNKFDDIFNTETKMMLESSNTKWLVLHKCIIKLIDNWDILKKYFTSLVAESKSKSTITVSKLFNDDSVKAYLLFLKYSLHFFNNLNDFYQSHRFLSHILLESSQQLIREVASNFMVPKALEDIVNINLSNHKNILNVNNIYVGPECRSFLRTLPPKLAREIRIQCRDFYTTAVYKMLECLPYKDTMFEQLMFLQPKIALYYDGRKKIRDLTSIAMCIGHPDITKLAYEWRILPTVYNDKEKEELAALEVDEMWKQILKYEDFNGDKMFLSLELLIESVLTFPHSNSEIKHITSMVTNIKCEEDDIQDSTRHDEILDSTIYDEIQDSTRRDEIQDNTRHDEIQDNIRHDEIQDSATHDEIQDIFIKKDPSE